MIRFILGVFFGIAISTVGLSGLTNAADSQIEKFKTVIKETAK